LGSPSGEQIVGLSRTGAAGREGESYNKRREGLMEKDGCQLKLLKGSRERRERRKNRE